eukprot:14729219-Alexandrium_andersonii.AAC.1
MSRNRHYAAAVATRRHLCVLGGCDGAAVLNSAERLDPAQGVRSVSANCAMTAVRNVSGAGQAWLKQT